MAIETFDQWFERTHSAHPTDTPATRLAIRAMKQAGWEAAMRAAARVSADDATPKLRGKYSPVDPVAYGAPVICPNSAIGITSTVVGQNSDLIRNVASLWIAPGDRVVDVTYGNGAFWTLLPDLQVEGTDLAYGDNVDCRILPYASRSVDVLVFDPPYQPVHGKPGRSFGVGESYRLNRTGNQTISEVLDLYGAGLAEAARVVKPGGRVFVKCQDMTYNHRLHLVHLCVLRRMATVGFDLADMFILVNQTRMPQPTKRQQRAHRSHSYLLVGVRMG